MPSISGSRLIILTFTANWLLLLFNLLPFFPLDGGRAARALLSLRWHPNRATMWVTTAGMIGGGLLMLLALTRGGVGSKLLLSAATLFVLYYSIESFAAAAGRPKPMVPRPPDVINWRGPSK